MNYIDEFKTDLKYIKNYSPNTVDAYISDIKAFVTYLEDKDVTKVDTTLIREYLKKISNKSDKSIARNMTSIRVFYDYLLKREIIVQNPTDGISSPKLGKSLPDVLSIDEIDKLLNFKPENAFTFRDRCMLELLYSSGLRISELVSMKFENINLDDCIVKVMGKGSKERIVPLNDITVSYLGEYIANIRPKMIKKTSNDYIFLNNHGKPITRQAVFKMIKKRADMVGIKKNISPHTLRHSFATHMLQQGADIRFIQELLGHSDVATTEIYTHIANEILKNDYRDLNPRDN